MDRCTDLCTRHVCTRVPARACLMRGMPRGWKGSSPTTVPTNAILGNHFSHHHVLVVMPEMEIVVVDDTRVPDTSAPLPPTLFLATFRGMPTASTGG